MFIARWMKVASVLLIAGATASGVEMLVRNAPAALKPPKRENLQAAPADDVPVQEVELGNLPVQVSERIHSKHPDSRNSGARSRALPQPSFRSCPMEATSKKVILSAS